MRKTIFLLAVFCGLSAQTVNVFAQQYVPMPDSNAVWKEWWCFLMTPPEIVYTNHYVNGDTVINSQSYIKVYSDGYYHSGWTGMYDGAIRNDTAAKLVYLVPRDSSNEVVLYDFNLVVGQIFPMTWFNQNNYTPETVDVIDSVPVGTSWRKRYRSTSGQYQIVEGMGSVGGLYQPYLTSGAIFTDLRCFYLDSLPAWPSVWNGCTTPADGVGIDEISTDDGMKIYPSPATTELNISFTQQPQNDFDVVLMSIDGRIAQQEHVNASAVCAMHIAGVAPGVYFVIVREAGSADRVQRVVIE